MRIATFLAPLLCSSTLFVRQVSSQSQDVDQEQSERYNEDLAVPRHSGQDSGHDHALVDEGEAEPQESASLDDHDVRHSPDPQEETAKLSYGQESDVLSSFRDSKNENLLSTTRATLIKQQVKRVGLGVDQLKQILVELQEEEEEEQRLENGFTSFESADEDDDRTLLDIFGEAAKEYLTKKVVRQWFLDLPFQEVTAAILTVQCRFQIPDTDPECRWNWQNLRCESACDCEFRIKRGDYHLGRACRLRTIPLYHCDESKLKPAITKRVASLFQQTVEILGSKIETTFVNFSKPICKDLLRLHAALGNQCLPRGRLPARNIPERLLCRSINFPVCPEDPAVEYMHRSYEP